MGFFVWLVLVFLLLTSYVTGHTFELTLKAKRVLNREVVRVVNLSWSFLVHMSGENEGLRHKVSKKALNSC